MSTTRTASFILILLFLFSVPYGLLVADVAESKPESDNFQIVPCGVDINGDGVVKGPGEECNFSALVAGTQRLINFLIYIGVFVASIMFTWGGILYVTSAGDEAKVKRAHSMFRNAAIGFIIALVAWLIVFAITSVFLDPSYTLIKSPN